MPTGQQRLTFHGRMGCGGALVCCCWAAAGGGVFSCLGTERRADLRHLPPSPSSAQSDSGEKRKLVASEGQEPAVRSFRGAPERGTYARQRTRYCQSRGTVRPAEHSVYAGSDPHATGELPVIIE